MSGQITHRIAGAPAAPSPDGGPLRDALPYQVALGRVASAVAGGAEPGDVLHEIGLCAARVYDADIAIVRATSPDGANFVVIEAIGPPTLAIGGLVGSYSAVTEELRASVPNSALAIDLRDGNALAGLSTNERWDFQHLGGRHGLIVPLHVRGRLVGRLDLVRIDGEAFPSEARVTVMPFAAFAATALREIDMQRQSDETLVYQTVAGLHQSIEQLADPETIMQAVAELVVREPGCARCYAMLWNAERGEFVPVAVAGLESHLVDILKLISLSPQIVPAFDQMLHSSNPILIPDASNSTLLPASLVRALGMHATMIVPLRGRRHQTIGVLLLDQAEGGPPFTERQAAVMGSMARHLSTTIENAILFEDVRTSSESMAVINEIAIQLAMLTDEESLFRQLHYQLASVLDATNFALGLLTADRRTLDVRFAADGEILPGSVRIPLGNDPLSTVAQSGRFEMAATRDGADTQPWLAHVEHRDVQPVHSHLTVPIAVGRNVIGALSVQSPFRNAYSPRDVELLSSIALHTGIAIENARLYRMVQTRGDRRAVVLDEVIQRQEIERKELVDEIHDDTLQVLAACLFRLDRAQEAVERLGRQDQALVQINDVREDLSENIARLRKRIFSLRPATLDRLGLEPALRELLAATAREHDIATELDIDLPARLTPEHEMLVYRVVQEAVSHIQARGGATTLKTRIRQRQHVVSILINHDGARGADLEPGFGADVADVDVALLALNERIELAGGHMRVAHRAGGGSLMQITVPGVTREEPRRFSEQGQFSWAAAPPRLSDGSGPRGSDHDPAG